MENYEWVHEGEEIDVISTIEWSNPITHDMLHSGLAESDDSAYFYAIIGLFEQVWWPFYIGKVYSQTISERHKNADHIQRLEELKSKYPKVTWHLTLGTPSIEDGRISSGIIDTIEGLLIYSNWHGESINKNKINDFNSDKHIQITNAGFSEPFHKKIGYGVFIES